MEVSAKTGKRYPKRLGYALEYAAKKLYNKQLAQRNPCLQFVSKDAEIKTLRKEEDKMRQLAAQYRRSLADDKRALAEQKAKAREAS
jgi:archaellum biogenesis protein FlaJ (TadC family)